MLVILFCVFPVGDICAVGSIPEGPGMTCFSLGWREWGFFAMGYFPNAADVP